MTIVEAYFHTQLRTKTKKNKDIHVNCSTRNIRLQAQVATLAKPLLVSDIFVLDVCLIYLSRHLNSLKCEHLTELDQPKCSFICLNSQNGLCLWRFAKWFRANRKTNKDEVFFFLAFQWNCVSNTVKFELCTYSVKYFLSSYEPQFDSSGLLLCICSLYQKIRSSALLEW